LTPLMRAWALLMAAISCELFASSCMKASQGFTRPGFSVGVVIGYIISFYLLSRAMEAIPLGTAYAVWSGVGTIGTLLIGAAIFREQLMPAQAIGAGLIIAGVVILHRATG
jgi:multidrug transporter EmrE-like cation transporter